MPAKEGKPKRKRTKRLTLAKAIAPELAKIPGATGWTLDKRKGRMEIVVEVEDKALTSESDPP